jgi:predicted dehydrogenase
MRKIKAGKRVFSEKPLARNAVTGAKIVEVCVDLQTVKISKNYIRSKSIA